MDDFTQAIKKANAYGMAEFLEIIGELSQQSTKKGHLSRVTKELITLGIALEKGCSRCIKIHTKAATKLGASAASIEQVRRIALFMRATPSDNKDLWSSWCASWDQFALSKGALKHGQRELIALAIALVMQHEAHIRLHIKDALSYRVQPEELFEVVPLALLMDGAPVLSQIPRLVKYIEKYNKNI